MSVLFSGTPISSTNKTNHHDITEILLKVLLNTIILFPESTCAVIVYLVSIYSNEMNNEIYLCVGGIGFVSVSDFDI
jgi:hypothetical protein